MTILTRALLIFPALYAAHVIIALLVNVAAALDQVHNIIAYHLAQVPKIAVCFAYGLGSWPFLLLGRMNRRMFKAPHDSVSELAAGSATGEENPC
jgi:hypothetical protein